MKMTKKLLSVVLAIAMSASLMVPVFAFPLSESEGGEKTGYVVNEYEYIKALETATTEKLQSINYTKEEASREVQAFEKAFDERARLSDKELEGLGYNAEAIEIMHKYAEGKTLTDAEYRAATAELTTYKIALGNCGTKAARFFYEWEWSQCPVITLKDSVAVRWMAYDSQGKDFNVLVTTVPQGTVDYYNGSKAYYTGQRVTLEGGLDFNSVNAQFPMMKTYTTPAGVNVQTYAKKGKLIINVKVDQSVSTNINYILVAAMYGHTTAGIGAPSVSLSAPPPAISISFSANMKVNQMGAYKAKIRNNSTIEKLPI